MKTPQSGLGFLRPLGRLTEDPAFLLCVGMALSGSLVGLLSIPLILYIRFALAGAEAGRRTTKGLNQVRTNFLKAPNLKLHKVRITKLIPKTILKDIEFRPSFARPGFKKIFSYPVVPFRLFWVEVKEPPLPTEWRAYPSVSSTQFIFITEEPDKLSSHGRFRLLHELGHVSLAGAGAAASARVEKNMLPILVGLILTLIWSGMLPEHLHMAARILLILYIVVEGFISPIEWNLLSEINSDKFAIQSLRTDAERHEVLDCCTNVWGKLISEKRGSFKQRLEWRLRLARMRSQVISDEIRSDMKRGWNFARSGDALGFWVANVVMVGSRKQLAERFGKHGKLELSALSWVIPIRTWIFSGLFFYVGFSCKNEEWSYIAAVIAAALITTYFQIMFINRAIREYSRVENLLNKEGLI